MDVMELRRALLQPHMLTISGIPVLINNARYLGSDGKFDSYTYDPDFFLAGWFDTGSSNSKSYTYNALFTDISACFRIFNDKSASSYDWWGINKWDDPRTMRTAGRYIVIPIRKAIADRSYMYDNTNQRYLFKGKNVT